STTVESRVRRRDPCRERVRLRLMQNAPAHSVYSPPPCGEGLGVGVARLDAPPLAIRTTPHPSPSRLRACPLPAKLKVTKPRQAGVWLGEGADGVRRSC